MNRRAFLRALPLAASVAPAALTKVATVPAIGEFVVRGTVVNRLVTATNVVMTHGSALLNSVVRIPWWGRGGLSWAENARGVEVANCIITRDAPPLWARVLGLR